MKYANKKKKKKRMKVFCFLWFLFLFQELMMVIDFGTGRFLKFKLGCGAKVCGRAITAGCAGNCGLTGGGAEGAGWSGCVFDFVQHFFHMVKLSKQISKAKPIIVAGDEMTQ